MRELEYPFKSEYIIARKKQLKRTLLAEKNDFLDIKIAILAGSTVNEVKDILELFLLNYGIKAEFYVSEYDKYYEDAVFENEKLESFSPNIIYIFTTSRNIRHDFDMSTREIDIEKKLNEEYDKYKSIWQAINDKYKAVIIQNNFEYPNYRLLGNKDISDVHGLSNFLHRLNEKFYNYVRDNKNFFICDINYIASDFGLSRWHNEKLYALYKLPCDLMAIPYISYNVSNIIKSLYGKNKKALALDLDNTLWGGIISEDGLDGIKVGPETAEGEIFLNFQKYIKKLKSLGVILNIVSKNDENIAISGLDNSDGVLKKEDFVGIKANWEPKSENIKELSRDLNIGSDAFAFVDDNPMERDVVSENVNGVGVANVTTPESYIDVLDKSAYFEATNMTKEDADKTKQYQTNLKRDSEKNKYENYSEYLLSLNMLAEIKPFESKYFGRISQLTNKSNQFNLTTKRYTLEDIKSIVKNSEYITLYGKLTDKFGDNGIVSLFIGRKDGMKLYIELFLMSCRVLKREMEFAMMDEVIRLCKKNGVEKIYGKYLKTEKNMMVKDLFADFGFKKVSKKENGDSEWELEDLKNYKNKCKSIKLI